MRSDSARMRWMECAGWARGRVALRMRLNR